MLNPFLSLRSVSVAGTAVRQAAGECLVIKCSLVEACQTELARKKAETHPAVCWVQGAPLLPAGARLTGRHDLRMLRCSWLHLASWTCRHCTRRGASQQSMAMHLLYLTGSQCTFGVGRAAAVRWWCVRTQQSPAVRCALVAGAQVSALTTVASIMGKRSEARWYWRDKLCYGGQRQTGRHRTGRHNLPGGRRCRGRPSCNFLVDCAGAASVVQLSLRHSKLTSATQWRAQTARGTQVLGGLLAAAGLVAARPAAAIDVFDDRKARDNGFDIIYEARDLDLPQSTRDGMTQARPNPVPDLLQHEQARARMPSLEMRWTCTPSTGCASCASWCPREGVAFGEQLTLTAEKGGDLHCASVRARATR